jgi:predicted solute-binding protein
MKDDVIIKHIQLYVNEFSKHIGEQGKKTVHLMEQIFNTLPKN